MGDVACMLGARYGLMDAPIPALRGRLIQIPDPDPAAFLERDSGVVSAYKDADTLLRSGDPAPKNHFVQTAR